MSDSPTCRYCGAGITFRLARDRLITTSWAWRDQADESHCPKGPFAGTHHPVEPVEGIDY